MPRIPNPYSPLSPIGKAISNLGQAFFSGPSPIQQQQIGSQMEYQKALRDKVVAEVQQEAAESAALGNYASLLGSGNMEPKGLAQASTLAGIKPSDLADMMTFYLSNTGAPEKDIYGALVGAGNVPSVNEGVTLDAQTRMRQQDVDQSMALQGMRDAGAMNRLQARPPSLADVRGGLLAENFGSLDELNPYQRKAIGAEPSSGGMTVYGPDGNPIVTTGGPLTTATRSQMQQQDLAAAEFKSYLDELRGVAGSDPTLFGTVGNVRRGAQALGQQAQNLGLVFGGDLEGTVAEAAQALVPQGVDPRIFDPNLTDIQKMSVLTAYKAAKMLDPSGRIAKDDFDKAMMVIGDPTAWTASQPAFMAGLNRLESMVASARAARAQAFSPGAAPAMSGAPAASAPAPAAPAPAQPASTPTNPQAGDEGLTATNPETGERIIFRNGRWEPL